MYLLAIKSFLYHFTQGSVHVLDDGSLTAADIELLKQHIPKISIQHIKNIDVSDFPTGNTWERLLYSIDLSQDSYVIQLDTDTLTMKPLLDVYNAVKSGRGFIIGNGPAWEQPIKVDYMHNIIKTWSTEPLHDHIQIASEIVFPDLPFFAESKNYYRGCSGFTGLPKGQISRELLQDFSRQVSAKIGQNKWHEWGSEQVACSVMISRTREPLILPWLLYQNFGFPSRHAKSLVTAVVVHFIGTYRFADRCYQKHASQFINDYGNPRA
jgi:hypothetical protein